ncbi:hypothetical protein BU26DRAFT_77895 [Trematosphaeria pertusa]|uniref:Uncharacterized protein n=1 Tax=Trematosphaeria pertusa TaxID=390896 RepID=A0A6A6I4F0_9PLEO|nr:uncharacterized protein BU26DRAFT_77895 [Trematosphaeria pertusa]KAF2245176.1 hypothetical protein BU26DRAFT_77895 [Trematosphaeria pertusa]
MLPIGGVRRKRGEHSGNLLAGRFLFTMVEASRAGVGRRPVSPPWGRKRRLACSVRDGKRKPRQGGGWTRGCRPPRGAARPRFRFRGTKATPWCVRRIACPSLILARPAEAHR